MLFSSKVIFYLNKGIKIMSIDTESDTATATAGRRVVEDAGEYCCLTVYNESGQVMTLKSINVTEGDQHQTPATTFLSGSGTQFGCHGTDNSMCGYSGNFSYEIANTGNPAVVIKWTASKPYDGNNSFTCIATGEQADLYDISVTPSFVSSDNDIFRNTTTITRIKNK